MISLKDLKVRYGAAEVISGLSVDISTGEFFTLLGPSGCGKTTVLRAIAGFVKTDSGQIILNDEDITRLPAEQRDVGMVFQNYALFPHMTVRENIAFGLRVARMRNTEISRRVDRILEVIGIEHHGDKKPEALSGGQQQRVAIARALVVGANVLLFDEPLSNLDTKVRDAMRREIKRLQRELDFTAVFVTHDQSEALSLSDRLLVLNNGRAEQIGTASELYMRPATPFVCEFIGESNLLGPNTRAALGCDGEGRCYVRPEDVHLEPASRNPANLLAAVTDIEFLGPTTTIELNFQGEQLSAIVAGSARHSGIEVGQQVDVSINPQEIHAFSET